MSSAIRNVTAADVERMRDTLFIFEGPTGHRKVSKFWVLLLLSGVIATAGVILDSTATVIGAMIVAPLMTPILGTGFALVLARRGNVLRSGGLVVAGALSIIVIAYVMGLADPIDVVASTNGQVAGRVSPGILDLTAALATGVVGAFAVVRSDVADTLPGVAIAISLVPPLAVVGLTLEAGAYDQAWGALLLFLTNVAAIIATATVVLLVYPVRAAAQDAGLDVGELRGRTLVVEGAVILVIAIPLMYGTYATWVAYEVTNRANEVASNWAQDVGWRVTDVSYSQGAVTVIAIGEPPEPSVDDLRSGLDDAGLETIPATVDFVVGDAVDVPVRSAPE